MGNKARSFALGQFANGFPILLDEPFMRAGKQPARRQANAGEGQSRDGKDRKPARSENGFHRMLLRSAADILVGGRKLARAIRGAGASGPQGHAPSLRFSCPPRLLLAEDSIRPASIADW